MSKQLGKQIGIVLESSPNTIVVEINSQESFEQDKAKFKIGRYLKVANGNNEFVIVSIQYVRALQFEKGDKVEFKFIISTQPLGTFNNEEFIRGNVTLPVPTEPVYLLEDDNIKNIFLIEDEFNFYLGKLAQNENIDFKIDGDKFFSKHIAIVGSTGSGKSCTVARILQEAVGISNCKNMYCDEQKNSHIIIYDIHSEYAAAFTLEENQKFTLNLLDVSNMILPYWLMNAEELESMFIESNEQNSHNQVSQFRHAVIMNKEKYNPSLRDITYDSPVYFSVDEVCNYIENLNDEVIGKKAGENKPKLSDGTLIEDRTQYFERVYSFAQSSQSKDEKASIGPFNGEFNRFILRLRTKIRDKRLKFLFNPKKENGLNYKTEDFQIIMKQFLGYINKSNVTIVDLSGIPFEVLNTTVSLMSRLIFDFCFYYSKLKHNQGLLNDAPVLIVCEEAHNYVPKSTEAQYSSSKKSIERIAKEGRKYGLSLMVVSQRPSEVSDTIFSQCNNFIALRLTNSSDQNYIKKLMPDTTNGVADVLPNLAPGEFVIVGDSVIVPSVIKTDMPNPEPESRTVKFHQEWQENWRVIKFEDVIKTWQKE